MSIPSWAKVGARVICIDVSGLGGTVLALRHTYTVTGAGISHKVATGGPCQGQANNPIVFLDGITNPFTVEGGFAAVRFRPIVTRSSEHDIALFKRIADDATQNEDISLEYLTELLNH